jgi:serine O-acetyltransferase
MSLQDRLLKASRLPILGRPAYLGLKLLGVEFPREVPIGAHVELAHGAVGLVVHRATRLGDHIILMPGVVIGRADAWVPPAQVEHLGGHVEVRDHVVIGAGAKVLFSAGQTLVLAEGTIVGANAVLRESTGPNEIWAGIPARRVGTREPSEVREAIR